MTILFGAYVTKEFIIIPYSIIFKISYQSKIRFITFNHCFKFPVLEKNVSLLVFVVYEIHKFFY